ncbi:MAG: acyl-CoA synthetase, partial [Cypionkella sp.]|nr:acyl-CoA synthetase [Cypionkella sp.]
MTGGFASRADLKAIEAESSWKNRDIAHSIYDFLSRTRAKHGPRPAISYQLLSGPTDPAQTLTWDQLHARVTQAANLFRSL